MSCNIRKYHSMDLGRGDEKMTLIAIVGDTPSIQFKIGKKYCELERDELLDLIDVILKRIEGKKGFRATERERDDIEYSDQPRDTETCKWCGRIGEILHGSLCYECAKYEAT